MPMNSKTLVFILFAAWCLLCGRWYVCGIKQACGSNATAAVPDNLITPAIEAEDTVVRYIPPGEDPATGAANKSQNNTGAPTTNTSAANNLSSIDVVNVEELPDRMIIHFPYNSTRREDNEAMDGNLDKLAQRLDASGGKVTITGHTDFVGDASSNYQFGLRRAQGIRDILIRKGVSSKQIRCKSAGDKKPVATNDTPRGRYLNRRVEIKYDE